MKDLIVNVLPITLFFKNLFPMSLLALALLISGCGRKDVDRQGNIRLRGEKPIHMDRKEPGDLLQKGVASWYGHPYHGRLTSSGQVYNMWQLTAAHKTLPFDTWIKVVNTTNQKSVIVRVNDRGPFVRGRVLDLSKAAARELDMIGTGIAKVKIYWADGPGDAQVQVQKPLPKPEPQGQGFWAVQVGSFSEEIRAQRFATELRAQFKGVAVRRFKNMYRVQVGQFAHRKEAEDLKWAIREQVAQPWVVFVEENP